MMPKSLFVLAVSLLLVGVAARAEAQLGCFVDGIGPVATCGTAADCVEVGGLDCTSGFCFCDGGPQSPFCPCAAAAPSPAPAPALSATGLIGLAALLGAVGWLGVWRRLGRRRGAS